MLCYSPSIAAIHHYLLHFVLLYIFNSAEIVETLRIVYPIKIHNNFQFNEKNAGNQRFRGNRLENQYIAHRSKWIYYFSVENTRERVLPVRCSNKIDCINCCEWRYNKIVHTECYCCTWCTRSLADYYTCHSWRIGWRIAWDVFDRSAHNLSERLRTMHSQNQELRSGLRKLTGNLNVTKTNFHIFPSLSLAHFAFLFLSKCSV